MGSSSGGVHLRAFLKATFVGGLRGEFQDWVAPPWPEAP
jgi:hypothetical protein